MRLVETSDKQGTVVGHKRHFWVQTPRPSLCSMYTGWPKQLAHFLYALTSSNIDRFSNVFHFLNRRTFVTILLLMIPPHLKCVATQPCEMSVS